MRKNDQPVGQILRALVKDLSLGPKLVQSELKSLWAKELGPMINKHTTEIRFKSGTLYVHVNSAPLRNELMYSKEILRKKLNDRLSDPVLQEIIIK